MCARSSHRQKRRRRTPGNRAGAVKFGELFGSDARTSVYGVNGGYNFEKGIRTFPGLSSTAHLIMTRGLKEKMRSLAHTADGIVRGTVSLDLDLSEQQKKQQKPQKQLQLQLKK